MEFGYCSVRFIKKLCETDIRFLWLLDEEDAPSHMTIDNFIKNELQHSLDDIFNDINSYIFGQLGVALNHAYIDGTKIEANANKYTWVWKKSCIRSRNNVFGKLSLILEEVNEVTAVYRKAVFEIRQEYAIEYVAYILNTFLEAIGMTAEDFVHGKGKHKTPIQRLYEKVYDCYKKPLDSAHKVIPKKRKIPWGCGWRTNFAPKSYPQLQNLKNWNGGSLFWNPPSFRGLLFYSPLYTGMYEAYFCCIMRLAEGLWYISANRELFSAQTEGKVTKHGRVYADGDILYAQITGGGEAYTEKQVQLDGLVLSPLVKYYKLPRDIIETTRQKILFYTSF